jgi:hypothetical protein
LSPGGKRNWNWPSLNLKPQFASNLRCFDRPISLPVRWIGRVEIGAVKEDKVLFRSLNFAGHFQFHIYDGFHF